MDDEPRFASVAQRVSQETIDRYAELSGDFNPIHVDPEAAALSEFGSTIAHGPIALQTFFVAATRALGSESLPPGAAVRVTYRHPVRPGDEVRCERDSGEPGGLEFACRNGEGTVVATVSLVLPEP